MCYKPKTIATRSYVVTPYGLEGEGKMTAQFPDVCTQATPEQGLCEINFDHCRYRKTGPPFPIVVVRCRTHGIAFTLYPPGYVPWGRKPWVHLSPDGFDLTRKAGHEGFRGTYFDAC